MRLIGFIGVILSILSVINGHGGQMFVQQRTSPMVFRDSPPMVFQAPSRIPFPQCVNSPTASSLFDPVNLQNLFQLKLQEEEKKLTQERVRNDDLKNSKHELYSTIHYSFFSLFKDDIMDFDAMQLRSDALNGALVARVATKVSEEIIHQ